LLKPVKWLSVLFLVFLACGLLFFSIYPDIAELKTTNPLKTAFMEYREREYKRKGTKLKIQKKWIGLSKISPYVVKALIISEDDKFWKHKGFDLDAIERAVEKDLQQGTFKFGASTISQQLVKNLYLSPSKNPLRKAVEAFLTWRMERAISKRRILELYLNLVEWGHGVFGVEAASLHYYGKSSSALNAQEAARLIAVLPNPRRYSVNGNFRYVERKAKLLYQIMVRRGIVIEPYGDAAAPETNEESARADQPRCIRD
jgi:monofunctional biosynthetic peptidoglycan transglycosylase